MKRIDKHKDKIIEYYKVGLSIRRLAVEFECSFQTMKKHLVKWEIFK